MIKKSRAGVAEGLKFGLVKKESLGAQGHTPQQGHPVKADIAQRMPPSAEARGLFLCGEQRKDEEKADMNMIYNSTSRNIIYFFFHTFYIASIIFCHNLTSKTYS